MIGFQYRDFFKGFSYKGQNLLGRKIKQKVLIVESDDWGMVRIESKEAYKKLMNKGVKVQNDPYSYHDFLETDESVQKLYDFLRSLKDHTGQPLRITGNLILSNPDYDKIKLSNFHEWHKTTLDIQYENKPSSKNVLTLFKQGAMEKLFIPQLHGREHLHIPSWLKALQNGHEETKIAFENHSYAHPSTHFKGSKMNFQTTFHSRDAYEENFADQSLIEGMKMFEEYFGFQSKSFIAPRYVWKEKLEERMAGLGVKTIQGKIYRFEPKDEETDQLKKVMRFQGSQGKYGTINCVRNVFFEPSQNPSFNWEKDAVRRIKAAFLLGKPAVVSMHRLNFVNGIYKNNLEASLERLRNLIKVVQKEYPEVLFLSTDQFHDLFN